VVAAQRTLVERLLELGGEDSVLAGLTADEVGGCDEGLCELADPPTLGELLEAPGMWLAVTS
jgi:hypothetical protein